MKPSPKLQAATLKALKLKLKLDELTAQFKEAQLEVIKLLIAEDAFNPDTKAVGPVRLLISPNRFFDLDTAVTIVSKEHPEYVEESKVEVIDPKKLKDHMSKIQIEEAMKDHPVPFKLGFAVAD